MPFGRRPAERGQHTSEVCPDVLHNECEYHVFLLSRRYKHIIAERQKCKKRHIVGDKHRAHERNDNDRDYSLSDASGHRNDAAGDYREKAYILQRTYDGERAEKARQRFEVKIADILIIRRHDKGGEHRRRKCHRKHNVILKKIRYSF